ncbi:hypothetical protein DPEC_G00078900 [Dallia pectoralis]|uniref:Uncharacterized protein n=1 Tax=Dallia pectoralis TaxID=75939 RepID=A0ACC2H4V5_DALPE|nr:hypothetical protein DPEC_G00078900 [Dallia pectoralis]
MIFGIIGVVLCKLLTCVDVMPQKDFNLEKMTGNWWMVGFATNAPWFVDHKEDMKMGTFITLPTASGDLELSNAHLNADGSCSKWTHLAKKTETPGRFNFTSQVWGNENDMRVVSVEYDDFALIHTIKTKNGVSEVANNLLSRTQDVSEAIQQKFRQFSLDTGVLADNIAILPKNGKCTEA